MPSTRYGVSRAAPLVLPTSRLYAGVVGRTDLLAAAVSASTAVSCTLVRLRALSATANGTTAVSVTLSKTGGPGAGEFVYVQPLFPAWQGQPVLAGFK